MIYVTIAVEDGENLLGLPGELVTASTENPYEGKYTSPFIDDMSPTPWQRDPIIRALKGQDGTNPAIDWIPHTGTECPVHPLDVVEVKRQDGQFIKPLRAKMFGWDDLSIPDLRIVSYRHATDPDGTPYVYDDGDLPEWAEYVATDEDGKVAGFEYKPRTDIDEWMINDSRENPHLDRCPPTKYANTKVHWPQSLRRVWRESKG